MSWWIPNLYLLVYPCFLKVFGESVDRMRLTREKNSCNIDSNFKHIRILDFKTFQLQVLFFASHTAKVKMKIADDSYGKESSACIMYVERVHVSGIIVIAMVEPEPLFHLYFGYCSI